MSLRKCGFLVIYALNVLCIVEGQQTGVNIIPLSACDDIALTGGVTISVPASYPVGVRLTNQRRCRFEVLSRNGAASLSPVTAVLENPFKLASGDFIAFIDGSKRNHFRSTCDRSLLTYAQTNSLVTVVQAGYTYAQPFSFNSTGGVLVIDYCAAGSSDVPVSFLISLYSGGSFLPFQTVVPPSFHLAATHAPAHAENSAGSGFYNNAVPSYNLQPVSTGTTPSCGFTQTPVDAVSITRIVNGDVAHMGNFPWVVALVHKVYRQFCGGTVLSADWILTAAHCIIGPLDIRDIQSNTNVVIGTLDLTKATPDNNYQIAAIVVHPNYDPKALPPLAGDKAVSSRAEDPSCVDTVHTVEYAGH